MHFLLEGFITAAWVATVSICLRPMRRNALLLARSPRPQVRRRI